jgi:hypothetical protein
VSTDPLNPLQCPHFSRYVEGNDTYIFVPDGVDGQMLTIHRSSGDIVLNRAFWDLFHVNNPEAVR